MSVLKQRVAMADVVGTKAFITTEWLKDLQGVIAETATAATSTTTTVSSDDISALKALIVALTRRVQTLEGGYQA